MRVIRPGEQVEEIKKKEPKQEVVEVVPKGKNWYLEKAMEKNELLSNMVGEWNGIVVPYNKSMFTFCKKLSELKKQFEHDSFSTIIREFSNHPDIRHPPSVGRIWQYIKLLDNKPEILKAIEYPDKKSNKENYYYKKDGSLFTEFYIELFGGRHALPDEVARVLEKRGRSESWSYRDLIEKIHEAKEDSDLTTVGSRLEKANLIRNIIAKLRTLSVADLKKLYSRMNDVANL